MANHSTLPTTREAHPEVDLWVAVIVAAIRDLTCKVLDDRERARHYLFGPDRNGDLAACCHYAGLDVSWVRAKAREALRSGVIVSESMEARA